MAADFDVKPLVYTMTQATVLLGCSRPHIYGLIDDGALEAFNDGRNLKITAKSIATYIARGIKARKAARKAAAAQCNCAGGPDTCTGACRAETAQRSVAEVA